MDDKYTSIDAYDDLIHYAKNGYEIKQWNDADKSAMITFDKDKNVDKVNIKSIKSNISLYGQFDAEEYVIIYSGNTATQTNEMKQFVKVDENVNLFSDSTFSNDGFKLKEWNTRPDGKGTSYTLGASFALNGEQYEDLKKVGGDNGEKVFTLYAIWEKVSGSDVPGGNTGGDDSDNTALYLIAGMLAVIAILAIVGIVLMRRK